MHSEITLFFIIIYMNLNNSDDFTTIDNNSNSTMSAV